MRLEKCSFCSSTIYPGHGVQFVRNDCKIFKFCRSKCHRAFKRKKNPRRTAWTKAYRMGRGKDLTEDPTLEFAQRRDVPVKYSRELFNKTVEVLKKVETIKLKRQRLHIKNRLKKGKQIRKAEDVRNIKKNIGLLKSPAAASSSKMAEAEMEDVEMSTDEEQSETEEAQMVAN